MLNILYNDLARFRQRTGVGGYVEELWQALHLKSGFCTLSETWYGQPAKLLMRRAFEGQNSECTSGGTSIVRQVIKTFGHTALESYLTFASLSRKPTLYHEPDLIPLIQNDCTIVTAHDLSVLRFPEWHPAHRVKHYENRIHRLKGKIARFIADSLQTKADLQSLAGVSEESIDVVHLAPRTSLMCALSTPSKSELSLPDHFILYAGTIEPRKNISGLLTAYRLLPDSVRKRYSLVLVGGTGWNSHALLDSLKDGRSEGIYYLGYLPDSELAQCLSRAAAFVYPSFFEGFGLPPLEAMAAGVPVISSHAGSLAEVLENAADIIDPADPQSIADAIAQVLNDEKHCRKLIDKGRERANQFSWKRTADLTWESYLKAVR